LPPITHILSLNTVTVCPQRGENGALPVTRVHVAPSVDDQTSLKNLAEVPSPKSPPPITHILPANATAPNDSRGENAAAGVDSVHISVGIGWPASAASPGWLLQPATSRPSAISNTTRIREKCRRLVSPLRWGAMQLIMVTIPYRNCKALANVA